MTPEIFELAAPLAGRRMRLDWQTHKAYVFGTYEPSVTQTLRQVVQSGWTVLDIGAHIGYYTLLLSELVGPQGKVVAFEALPENFAVLRENVETNGCRNVVLENRAVAACSGRLTLRRNDDDPLTSTASIESGKAIREVESVALDDLLKPPSGRISFVKIDVEGAETAVLEGMQNVLQTDRPVLLIELHGIDICKEQHPVLCKLRGLGYESRYLDRPGTTVHILSQFGSGELQRSKIN